jgi:GNAT superfamily N-acetyltransferase
MSELHVEVGPKKEDVALLTQRLREYNTVASERAESIELGAFLRDERGELTGGIYARTWSNCCEIEYLWVDESQRGKGTGSQLLVALEEAARERNCVRMVVTTFSFQARPFYERHGYEVVGTVPEYPKGHELYLLTKTF